MNNKKTWLKYWQEEVDAAFLYTKLAGITNDQDKGDRYRSLAAVEEKHVLAWENLLREEGLKIPVKKPSAKASLKFFIGRYFGLGLLEGMMLQEEAKEVKSYLFLHKSSTHLRTQKIALDLARDSASHASKLTETLDRESEPWHKMGSGGILRDTIYGFNGWAYRKLWPDCRHHRGQDGQ